MLSELSVCFWSGPEVKENVIQAGPFRAPPDDDDRPEDTYLTVTIDVGMKGFERFATCRGSLKVENSQWVYSWDIHQGETHNFVVDLKSLDEVYAQSADFQKKMEGHVLYATKVVIKTRETVDGAHQPEKPPEEYYLCRFVTALSDTTRFGLVGTPALKYDMIPFEFTAFDSRPESSWTATNTKLVQVVSSQFPTLTVEGSSQAGLPSPFRDAGGTAGKHFIEYKPNGVASDSHTDSGRININYANKSVGEILLEGKVVTPRKWSVDIDALAQQLQDSFKNGQDPRFGKTYFEDMAKEVVTKVQSSSQSFWYNNAQHVPWTASLPANTIRVTFRDDGKEPYTEIVSANAFRWKWQQLVQCLGKINNITRAHLLEYYLLESGLKLNPAPPITMDVKYFRNTGDPNCFADATYYSVAVERLAKSLMHELGHAHFFPGHIVPRVYEESSSLKDVMQQAFYLNNTTFPRPSFGVLVSGPFLLLLVGRGWDDKNIDAVFANSQQPSTPGSRWHDINDGSLLFSSISVTKPGRITLTTHGVTGPNGTVSSVAFYREANDLAGLQTGTGGDLLLFVDTNATDGWTTTVSTDTLPPVDHTFYAVATGDDGETSTPVSTTVTVEDANGNGVLKIDIFLVRDASSFDSLGTGERSTLPTNAEWIDEWDSFWVEVWVGTPDTDDIGVSSVQLDLIYSTVCFTATEIEYGAGFDALRTGMIDDEVGIVDDLGAATLSTDVGDDRYALLARVRFESKSGDLGVPLGADNKYVTPVANGFGRSDARGALVGSAPARVELGDLPATELWPVMYDLDDNGRVGPGDLSYFAAAYGKPAGAPGVTYSRVCDFDGNGVIGPGDLSYFAAAYSRKHTDADMQSYPGNFPSAWRQTTEPTTSRLAERVNAIAPIEKDSVTKLLIQTAPESATAALDTALAEEYGPAIEQPSLLNRHAAWLSMVARRQSNRRDGGDLGRAELAVDLLMAGR
ncbi:MAG TPA: hypothetical protein DD670_10740 [Planctomycetaceae bacterium]|nr:hypothetical protein [Planctomycetaceae bacterium]